MLLLRMLNPIRPGKEGPYDTFLAGLLGGYTVFGRGRQGSVNQQVPPSTNPSILHLHQPSNPSTYLDRNLRLRARHARPRQTLHPTPPYPLLPLRRTLYHILPPPHLPRARKNPSRRLARLCQPELGPSHVHLSVVS
jgi:hypothetical protein